MAFVSVCEMQALREAPHDMRDCVACERGHAYCIPCLGEHNLQCGRCGGLACCFCPGNGEARCPECTRLGRLPHSLCGPCFQANRFHCCKKAGRTLARCDYHHWHSSICACGADVCATCRRRGYCPCGDLRIITLGNDPETPDGTRTTAVKPNDRVALVTPPPRAPQKKARSPPAHERSAFQSPRFRPASAPVDVPAFTDIECI